MRRWPCDSRNTPHNGLDRALYHFFALGGLGFAAQREDAAGCAGVQSGKGVRRERGELRSGANSATSVRSRRCARRDRREAHLHRHLLPRLRAHAHNLCVKFAPRGHCVHGFFNISVCRTDLGGTAAQAWLQCCTSTQERRSIAPSVASSLAGDRSSISVPRTYPLGDTGTHHLR